MDDPIYLPATRNREAGTHLSLGATFLAMVLVPSFWWPSALGLGLVYFPMAAGALWGAWRAQRLSPRGVVIDDEGIGPSEDGMRLWTLPWGCYGGYRQAEATFRERLTRPERSGFEILDRQGQPSFVLRIPEGGGSYAYSARAVRNELDRRVPGDGFPFDPNASVRPRVGFVASALLVGVLLAAFSWWGLDHEAMSSAWTLGFFALVVSPGCFCAAGMEAFSLRQKARGRLASHRVPPPLPQEGPALERHLARHSRRPVTLEEGHRYRTVESNRRRKELRAGADAIWILAPLGTFALVYAWMGVADPKLLPLAVLGFGFFAGLSAFGLSSSLGSRRLLASVDDTLWVHDGHLVVVRPEGEPLTLPLPTAGDRAALRRRARTGATDVWRLPGGGRYAIDRTRLYATELPEELRAASPGA